MRLGGLSLGLGLSLEVLEGEIADETTNSDNAVEAEAAASLGGAVVGRVGVGVGFGDRIAGLGNKMLVGNIFHMSRIGVILGGAYLALQLANKQLLKGLAGLVAVADIFESLGGILAGDIQQNLLATARKKNQSQQLVISQKLASLFLSSCLRGPRKKKEG